MASVGYGYVSQGLYATKDNKYIFEAKVRLAEQFGCKVADINWKIEERHLSYEQTNK